MEFQEYCKARIAQVDDFLGKSMVQGSISTIEQAMNYSLMAGGKRLRPLLLMAAADVAGGKGELFINAACALEMIHTYSLIHDDLPAMDNDDYRRGKLTNHKVFGEAVAILAGDALLTMAFECLAKQEHVQPALLLEVVKDFAQHAGRCGMVGGQVLDMLAETGEIKLTPQQLQVMHGAKTGGLFKAAICSGGKLTGANAEQLAVLEKFAENYGLVFQITDDILDVEGSFEDLGKPVGSDLRNQKTTYVSMHGLNGAKQLARDLAASARKDLEIFGEKGQLLNVFMEQLLTRKS